MLIDKPSVQFVTTQNDEGRASLWQTRKAGQALDRRGRQGKSLTDEEGRASL